MPTQQKIDRVQELKDRIERSTITLATNYAGITVNQMTELRRAMRAGGIEFAVVKNTLTYLAADEAQRPQVKEIIQGPTALAFGYDDPSDAAKVLTGYARANNVAIAIRGAVLGNGAAMGPEEVTRLATLPPRPQMLAILLGQMQSPIARLLGALNGPVQNLENVLQARIRQLESEQPVPDQQLESEQPVPDQQLESEQTVPDQSSI